MPRPRKCRRVCGFPENLEFSPADGRNEKEPIVLTLDEYETIRLIDKEGFSQEQCSQQMQIARTTVQRIYDSARRKIADVLVEGFPLKIQGGDYRLCNGKDDGCGFSHCRSRLENIQIRNKGEYTMRIAVPYENGSIFQHFGHTDQFKVYDAEEGKVISSRVVSTNGSGHGALAGLLQNLNVDALICGGIGGGAKMALAEAGIQLYGGVSGSADEAVDAFLSHALSYNPDVMCSHHEEHHHDGGCGTHGCGGHHCGEAE